MAPDSMLQFFGLMGPVDPTLIAIQLGLLLVGLGLAFFGERIHAVVISVCGLLMGASGGFVIVPSLLFADVSAGVGFVGTAVATVVFAVIGFYVVWMSIIFAVFFAGAVVGYLLGGTVVGTFDPFLVGGGLIAGFLIGLVLAIFAMGVAFTIAYLAQALGLYGLRDFAFKINSLPAMWTGRSRVEDTDDPGDTDGPRDIDDKFEGEGTYFDDGPTEEVKTDDHPIIPEDNVRNAGPIQAVLMAAVGLVLFGFMTYMSFSIFGGPALVAVFSLREGLVVGVLAVLSGRVAVRLYRPFVAISTAFSGAALVALTVSTPELFNLLLSESIDGLVQLIKSSSLLFFLLFGVVFFAGSGFQLWHLSEGEKSVTL